MESAITSNKTRATICMRYGDQECHKNSILSVTRSDINENVAVLHPTLIRDILFAVENFCDGIRQKNECTERHACPMDDIRDWLVIES